MPRKPVESAPPAYPVADAAERELRHIGRGIWFLFILAFFASMYYARDFFVPLLLALLVYFTLAGPVRYLADKGVPPGVSASILVVLLLAGIAALAMGLSDNVMAALEEAPAIIAKVKAALAESGKSINNLIDMVRSLESLGPMRPSGAAQEVVTAPPGLLALAADGATRFVATFAVTIVLVVFLLASGDMFLHKLVRISPRLSDKKRAVQIVRDIQIEVSHYLLTITLINATLGAVTAVVMYGLGMPQPVLLGVAAAALNFIPYVGALLMVVILAFLSFATLGAMLFAVIPPLIYLGLHTLESGFISPLVLGKRLRLNAVAVFTGIAFWGWMWGLIGALMAVPLLVIVKIFSDHVESMRVLGEFLSDESNGETVAERAEKPAAGE